MLLAIDVDNSHFSMGCIRESKVLCRSRAASDKKMSADQYAMTIKLLLELRGINLKDIGGCIICSVVPELTDRIKEAVYLLLSIRPLVVGPGVKTGLNIKMDNPAQLGSDLVVTSVACAMKYNLPAIVINMTTATTFAVLNEKGEYVGGCLFPGMELSLDSFIESAAQISSVSLEKPRRIIGTNTNDSIRSGVLYGTAAMIDGMIAKIEEEYGQKCEIVLSGPEAKTIYPYCSTKMHYAEDLVFDGLYYIYQKNKV